MADYQVGQLNQVNRREPALCYIRAAFLQQRFAAELPKGTPLRRYHFANKYEKNNWNSEKKKAFGTQFRKKFRK